MRFPPAFLRGRNDDTSQSPNIIETSSCAPFCTRIKQVWFVLQSSSIYKEEAPPCVSGLFWSKGRMKSLHSARIAWKLPPFSVLQWDSRDLVSSSKCTNLRHKEPPCVYALLLSKGVKKTLRGLRIAWKLPPLLSFA